MDNLSLRFLKAANRVRNQFPYYSPAIERLRFRVDEETDTMAINCKLVITMNEKYSKKLDDIELESVILHEVMHYVYNHHERYITNPLREKIPHVVHNIAMDLEINEFIKKIPKSSFKAKDFNLPERKSYEEYLGMLNREMPKKLQQLMDAMTGKSKSDGSNNSQDNEDGNKNEDVDKNVNEKGNGDKNGPIFPEDKNAKEKDFILPNDVEITDDEYKEFQEIYKEILLSLIYEMEKAAGKGDGAGDVIRKIKKKSYDWKQVFQSIITTKTTEITAGFKYRTYERASRRYSHNPDIIFPQFVDFKQKINLIIIMDVSGSMGENVNKMYGIMKSMIDIMDIEIKITILETSCGVENIIHDFNFNAEKIGSVDGGGTEMMSGIRYIYDERMEADLIIIMTDSYTDWPRPHLFMEKTVVLTDNPNDYTGPYPMYPVIF